MDFSVVSMGGISMKKCIVIFGLLMMVSSVMADDNTNTNVYIRNLINDMQNTIDNTNSVKLDSEAQEFVKSIEKMSDDKIAFFKLLFFSERLLWRVYDDYVAILEQKSQETGREIVKSVSDEDKTMELDTTGVADDKCLLQDLCAYPDGFEECQVSLMDDGDMSDGSWKAKLFISCDDKKTNLVNSISIIVNANMGKNTGELFVSVGGNESKYDKEVEYRQNNVDVWRYNVQQQKKYGKKAVYKEEDLMPETEVYMKNFSVMYNG